MRSIRFWKTEIRSLSLTERIFFRDAIKTLQSWSALREEYGDLDLIKRVLESEMVLYPSGPRIEEDGRLGYVAAAPQKAANSE